MERRNKPTRLLCLNCNICINTFRRYQILDQDTRICSILCSWIYPRLVTDDDYVCEECWKLSIAAIDKNLEQNISNDDELAGPSPRGHIHVCRLCGCSIARKQNDKILRENPTELEQDMVNQIIMKIDAQKLTPADRVCHACWLRTKREALRMKQANESRILERRPQDEINALQEHEPSQNFQKAKTQNTTEIIALPGYKRAANTANHCVFSNCTNIGTLHSVPDQFRAIILSKHKYYIPKLARVCGNHLTSNSWDSLYASKNSSNTFNAEQIQHIFSFVNAFEP